jgi:DNA-binding Lrp family transcriptional regulator
LSSGFLGFLKNYRGILKMSDWTFITNHGLVLASIAKNPERTAREIGDDVGVTERTAHKIIMELDSDGYITKTKVGKRNAYRIHPGVPIKSGDAAVGELLMMLGWKRQKRQKTTR